MQVVSINLNVSENILRGIAAEIEFQGPMSIVSRWLIASWMAHPRGMELATTGMGQFAAYLSACN